MLNERETATVLAALWFWREEMLPHGAAVRRPYFQRVGFPRAVTLSSLEITRLSQRLKAAARGGRQRQP